ncbi:rhodanese-like domain-containing protein [Thalassotalea maritima]|uniref:rhodanese-like domain-containing protein n=1 Tax=Thalassotalea maritima TaxID=3242416 RepID=UPI003529ACCB
MKQLTITLLLLSSLLFSTFSFADSSAELPEQITQQQLIAMQQSQLPFLLLDVRSEEEYQQGHIAGAINIDFRQLSDNLEILNQYKEQNIVVYCRSGRRAGIAIDELTKLGFSNLTHLEGDMQLWRKNQRPEQKEQQ